MVAIEPPPPEVVAALGLAKPSAGRRRKNGKSCADCYFHRRMLCALDLAEPCSTFRPDAPDGLVPPRQPTLLVREPSAAATEQG